MRTDLFDFELPTDRIDIQLSLQSALGPNSRFCVVTGYGAAAAKDSAMRRVISWSSFSRPSR
jgi:hypothetical protein